MEEMTIWEQYTVTLNKDPRMGFGIAVSGGRDKPSSADGDPSVIISDVVRGGPADGRLQTRDRIVMVNAVSMIGVTSSFAIQTLRTCGRTANLTVKRSRKIQIPSSRSASHVPSQDSFRSGANRHDDFASDEDDGYRANKPNSYHLQSRDQNSDYSRGYSTNNYSVDRERQNQNNDSYNERSYSHYSERHASKSDYDQYSQDDINERQSHAETYERRSEDGSYYRSNHGSDSNASPVPLVSSGFKRLPQLEDQLKPMRATLVKSRSNEEYGLKLGSQIYVKHMTPTGLAAKEGILQEGDLVLKINGVVTENMSLADTKRLIEKSEGKLDLWVLRDNQQILVSLPEMHDSDAYSSDEIEDISDIESDNVRHPKQNIPRAEPDGIVKELSRIPDTPNGRLVVPSIELNSEPLYDQPAKEQSIYSTWPRAPVRRLSDDYSVGYSPDTKLVSFVKEESIGLRLAGGNDVGIFVAGVQSGSPAEKQGIQEGYQILKVNNVSFQNLTREEAVLFLLDIPRGEEVLIEAQNKQDIYRKMLLSNVGDSFHIRTHFDYDATNPYTLNFSRGDVFRVMDTMHDGKLGAWLASRVGPDFKELEKGIIPNKSRAEQIANVEVVQKLSTSSSGARAEFWKMRGLRGVKKNLRKSKDDLAALTARNKFPPYEKVVLREANYKRPVVVLGPITDVALQRLSSEWPEECEMAQTVPRGEGTSVVIKLDAVQKIAERNKHALLDITPSAIERLNYIQYYPIVVFCNPESKQGVKVMRQRLCPQTNRSCRKLYAQAVKLKKYCSHLFTATINLSSGSDSWYLSLKNIIKEHQSRPIWFAEEKDASRTDDGLEMINEPMASTSDYLSCDSRANSDYEDTDAEGGAYTDNEMEDTFEEPALARSSEPVRDEDDYPATHFHGYGNRESPLQSHSPEQVQAAQAEGQKREELDDRQYEISRLKKKFAHARTSYSSEEEEEDYSWGPATEL
ncbi:tight junction protein ZO-3 [Protopterus annectens]|uniref:tight junction protein ZO-3 n=1 Tax=Protopterus annectens TaxID=7888 RepID=UPI001CF9D717|nr:tight junction protein ZO-3 [Protopterus annectens]